MSRTFRKTEEGVKVPESIAVIKRLSKKGVYGTYVTSRQSCTIKKSLVCDSNDEQLQKFVTWCRENNHMPKEIISVNNATLAVYCEFPKSLINEYRKIGVFHYHWTLSKPSDNTVKFFDSKDYTNYFGKAIKLDKKTITLRVETKMYYYNSLEEEYSFPRVRSYRYSCRCLLNKTASDRRREMSTNYQIKQIC